MLYFTTIQMVFWFLRSWKNQAPSESFPRETFKMRRPLACKSCLRFLFCFHCFIYLLYCTFDNYYYNFVLLRSRSEIRRSKLISGPTNFSHIAHVGPREGIGIMLDKQQDGCVCVANNLVNSLHIYLMFTSRFLMNNVRIAWCLLCSGKADRRSKVISSPLSFSHVAHMGPDLNRQTFIDLSTVS